MIKCNAKVCGVVNRAATVKQSADGKSFVTFGLSVDVPATKGNVTPILVSVAADDADISTLTLNRKVTINGTLRIKGGADRKTFFNLSADTITVDSNDAPGIFGEIEFRGTCCKDIVTPTDKKGNRFLRFSAYSTDKVGEEFFSVFVRFVQFGGEIPTFVIPKAKIDVKGELRVSTFNGNLDLNCKINSIQEYVKLPF